MVFSGAVLARLAVGRLLEVLFGTFSRGTSKVISLASSGRVYFGVTNAVVTAVFNLIRKLHYVTHIAHAGHHAASA